MLKISVKESIFQNILLTKEKLLYINESSYWKKELFEPTILEDKIIYNIKKIKSITITHGLGVDKPKMLLECKKIIHNKKNRRFEFLLGSIIEQKNTQHIDLKDDLIKKLQKENEELLSSMNTDALTGVYNRRKMQIDLEFFSQQDNSNLLSAVFIDADRFKGINDNFGHQAGDDVLKYIAQKIKKHATLFNGEVYRYGGEEFLILCFKKKNILLEGLKFLKEDIKSETIPHLIKDISVSVSMGVSFYNEVSSIDELIKKADEGVYKAKENGRDKIELG